MKLIKSFRYALNGIVTTVKTERNMRIHLAATFYVYLFSLFYEFSLVQYAILTLAVGIVLFAEMVNTAFERYVDHETHEIEEYARIAKDTAAGAVLLSALAAGGVGVFLFWDTAVFSLIGAFFTSRPIWIIWVIASLMVWLLFIFKPRWERGKDGKSTKKSG